MRLKNRPGCFVVVELLKSMLCGSLCVCICVLFYMAAFKYSYITNDKSKALTFFCAVPFKKSFPYFPSFINTYRHTNADTHTNSWAQAYADKHNTYKKFNRAYYVIVVVVIKCDKCP